MKRALAAAKAAVVTSFLCSMAVVESATLQRKHLRTHALNASSAEAKQLSFSQFVEARTIGRGIWKWSNALAAYEVHFGRYKNQPFKLGEVGVWSGGSLDMWHAVLGAQGHVYGFDIMKTALAFQDARTTITIMDQGDPAAWANFFSTVSPNLDILLDDGGHQAHQMQTTTQQVWPRINPGGILAIEDIVGAHYLQDFFLPAAQFYGGAGNAELQSLHLYPLVLIAEKKGPNKAVLDPSTWGGVVTTVSTLEELTPAINVAAAGSRVVLKNAAWGTLLNTQSLQQIFTAFNGLYAPAQMADSPQGCSQTSQAVCTYGVVNSEQQAKVTGVHILPNKVVVDIAATTPVIQAVRHGDQWVQYGR